MKCRPCEARASVKLFCIEERQKLTQSIVQHGSHTIGSKRSTSDRVNLCSRVGNLLLHRQRDTAVVIALEELLSLELLLPFLVVLNLSTQSGSLTLMIEISTINR